MNAVIVIPSRYASTRFPGKPLTMISGKSLIRRVWERASASRLASSVWIATDDARIADHVRQFGASLVMTSPDLPTGTDRIAAALEEIERVTGTVADQVINVQGDEPLIDIDEVDRMIEVLQLDGPDIVTLSCPLRSEDEFGDPDVVKVVSDLEGNALYFSRAPIPAGAQTLARRHVGVYGYQGAALRRFASLPPSPLEHAERLEQLRALQNRFTIRVLETSAPHLGVDRPEDVARIERELAENG
ncbi:MAG: 3-deoxy-manno-octulosonate cytidylyltransferase [Thermoanaerobaculia bacterium]